MFQESETTAQLSGTADKAREIGTVPPKSGQLAVLSTYAFLVSMLLFSNILRCLCIR